MERRAFLELLAATPLAKTARAEAGVDRPPPPAYRVVTRFAPAAVPGMPGRFPGAWSAPARRGHARRAGSSTRPSCAR